MSLTQLLIFVPTALLVGASPGANNLLAFLSASRSGWRAALLGLVGRVAGWGLLVLLVSLGLDGLLATSESAFVTLKWLGVLYLLYLAWKLWNAEAVASPAPPRARTLMLREFLTLLGNPKAYLLLTAFLPQFVEPGSPLMPQLLSLGTVYLALEAAAALLWIAAGAGLGSRALTPLRRRILNRLSGGVMAAAALLLARSERAG